MKNHNLSPRASRSSSRGGVLIVAIVFSAISALTVGSFIRLAHHELRLSNTQFYTNEAINLAEAGLEEALHALNFKTWSGWHTNGGTARFSSKDIPIGRAATGEFYILVIDRNDDPIVTAEGRVTSSSGLTTSRQIRISLREISYFANGITARNSIIFSGGNPNVDSYDSREGPYHPSRRRDRGTVASVSVKTDAIQLGNADIWGYAFTGGEDPDVRNGTIRGEDTPSGVKIDQNRIARDFSSDFPFPRQPPAPDYSYDSIGDGMTLGTPTPEGEDPVWTVVETNSISLTQELEIDGPVILIIHGNARFSGGNGGLTVTENGNLRVYAYNDFTVTGQGMGNRTQDPSKLVIFGMNTVHQEFGLGGNAQWEAAIYAPNANLDLNGGGNSGHMSGAVVGKNVKLNGNSKFHYDEALADFTDAFGFAMDSWTEVKRSDWVMFN